MKNNKASLILIIILLIIFLPAAIYGTIYNSTHVKDDNPSHLLYYKGYIWFYDYTNNNTLLSKYECKTEKCSISTSTIDDKEYGIQYYNSNDNINLTNGDYTFITDGDDVYLYSIKNGSTLQSYSAIKNYNTNVENNVLLIKNTSGLWGAISLKDGISSVLPFEYTFIALPSKINSNNELAASTFIVLKNNKWSLVSDKNAVISKEYSNPIIDFNNNYIFINYNGKIKVYDYNDTEYLNAYKIDKIIYADKYIGIVSDNNIYIFDDLNENPIKELSINEEIISISLQLKENDLEIILNDTVLDSFKVS
jgi:hypothetical protein